MHCQGFSLKGKKLGLKDPRNYLFKEYLSIVDKLQPEVFITENVKALLSTSAGWFKEHSSQKRKRCISSARLGKFLLKSISFMNISACSTGVFPSSSFLTDGEIRLLKNFLFFFSGLLGYELDYFLFKRVLCVFRCFQPYIHDYIISHKNKAFRVIFDCFHIAHLPPFLRETSDFGC